MAKIGPQQRVYVCVLVVVVVVKTNKQKQSIKNTISLIEYTINNV